VTTENKTLLLIDGHSLALRSFFGIYTMAEKTGQHIFVRSDGQHTEAVHAFLSTLLSIIKDNQPSHIAVAFDLPGGTFRTAEYGEYKGGRNAIPEAFNGQIDLIKKMLGALNIPALTYENYEADDIVATLTRRGTEAGYKVLILSGDRDIFQLVTDDVTLLYPVTTGPSKGIQRMDPAAVEKKTKVPPHMYPDLAALTGEQADNLPGVPGVGPGFAAKWLGEYGSLDAVIENSDKIGGKKGEALRENIDNVVRNRRLNQLVNDLDLNVTLEDTAFTPDLDALNAFFDEVEFRTIRKRAADTLGPIVRAAGSAGSAVSTAEAGEEGATKKAPTGPVYAPIATSAPIKNADAAAFRAFCAAAAEENYGTDEQGAPIAVPERLEGAVTLYPVTNLPVARPAIGDAPAVKVTKTKIRAAEENPELLGVLLTSKSTSLWIDTRTIDPELDAALAAWLSDEAARKIVMDLKVQRKLLRAYGYELAGAVEDPALSSYMCGFIPTATRKLFSERMEDLAERYLWIPKDPYAQLVFQPEEDEAEPSLFSLPGEAEPVDNLRYFTQISRIIHELARLLHYEMEEHGQLKVYEEIELPLLYVLADMEQAGIAVSDALLTELHETFSARANQAQESARAIIGDTVQTDDGEEPLNLASVKQLQTVLFETLGLPHTRKIKSGYSTDAESVTELLSKISPESDGAAFLGALIAYRDNIKLAQTVEGLQKAATEDGRVHTTFQQGAASTGRLSSTAPNLQNIPIRTEEGRRIRGAFIVAPEPIDGVEYEGLLTADYSQIEMRIMVHLAADEKLIAAYEAGEDLHRYVGSEVFGVAPEDVTPEQRSKVKAMSYGLAYGLSRFGLAKQLNISSDEAGELRTNYFKRFGRVGRFLRGVLKQAHQDGYTETIFGRRRVLPDLDSPNRVRREAAERAALNAPIQGTAADIIKIAMINIHRRLREEGLKTRMLLQVHDEIILEVATGEREAAERVLVEEMSGAASLRVPLDVQVGWGKSWQEAGH